MLKPVGERLIVKPPPKETETASGIIIPDSVRQERPQRGTIEATHEGSQFKVGQEILFSRFCSEEFELEGESLFVVHESGVLGIYE